MEGSRNMLIEEMIAAVQKKLGVQVDGRAGTETWGAIYAHIVKAKVDGLQPAEAISEVDARSEKVIATLQPQLHPLARALVQKAARNGIQIKLISGLRTYAEQNALYAQGRTLPGRTVTNARGGYSNHNFGIAFDVGVFEGTRYLGESPKYKAVGALGMELGLEWGGSWKSIVDEPHFQLRPAWATDLSERQMLAQLRGVVAENRPIFA
jgi:peptidoglycan LD-endopeptidase CwlK